MLQQLFPGGKAVTHVTAGHRRETNVTCSSNSKRPFPDTVFCEDPCLVGGGKEDCFLCMSPLESKHVSLLPQCYGCNAQGISTKVHTQCGRDYLGLNASRFEKEATDQVKHLICPDLYIKPSDGPPECQIFSSDLNDVLDRDKVPLESCHLCNMKLETRAGASLHLNPRANVNKNLLSPLEIKMIEHRAFTCIRSMSLCKHTGCGFSLPLCEKDGHEEFCATLTVEQRKVRTKQDQEDTLRRKECATYVKASRDYEVEEAEAELREEAAEAEAEAAREDQTEYQDDDLEEDADDMLARAIENSMVVY